MQFQPKTIEYTGTWPALVMSQLRVRSPANTIVVNRNCPSQNGQMMMEGLASNTSSHMNNNSNSGVMLSQLTATTQMEQGLLQHGGRFGTPDVDHNMMMSSASSESNNKYLIQDAAAAIIPAQQDLFSKLHEALALEPKYQPNLFLPQQSNVSYTHTTAFLFSLYFPVYFVGFISAGKP